MGFTNLLNHRGYTGSVEIHEPEMRGGKGRLVLMVDTSASGRSANPESLKLLSGGCLCGIGYFCCST